MKPYLVTFKNLLLNDVGDWKTSSGSWFHNQDLGDIFRCAESALLIGCWLSIGNINVDMK